MHEGIPHSIVYNRNWNQSKWLSVVNSSITNGKKRLPIGIKNADVDLY